MPVGSWKCCERWCAIDSGRHDSVRPTSGCVFGCANWPNNDAAGDIGGCMFCSNERAGWSTASASIGSTWRRSWWCAGASADAGFAPRHACCCPANAQQRDLDDGFSARCFGYGPEGTDAVDRRCLHAAAAGHRGRYFAACAWSACWSGCASSADCHCGLSLITAQSSLLKRLTNGPMKTRSYCTSSRPAGPWKTAKSKASTASSARNASTNTGSSHWTMRGRRLKAGGSTTTRCAHIAHLPIERRKSSQ